MAAPKGNRFWEARSKHGRAKIFKTPRSLWKAACEYFEYVESNPIIEKRTSMYKGVPVVLETEKMRPMTIEGLCLFLDVCTQTWREYHKREDYFGVTDKIQNVIKSQKFEGAAVGIFNSNIIARDLGLVDKKADEHTGAGGGPIQTVGWVVNPVKPINET